MQKLASLFRINRLLATASLPLLLSIQGLVLAAQAPPKLKDVASDDEQAETITQGAAVVGTGQKKLVKVGPDDKYDRGVPRNSVAEYFVAVKAGDYKRAKSYLDLRNLPRGYTGNDGPELARQLKIVLDRSLWVDLDLLSTEDEGHSDDGLPSYRDLVGQIEVNNKKYDILLQHVPRSDGVKIWKFASKTVRNIPELYDALGYGPIGEKISKYTPEYELLGLQIWQWVFLCLIALSALLVTFPIVRLISWLVGRRQTEMSLMMARFMNGPLNAVFVVLITRHFIYLIHPSLAARAVSEGRTVLIIVFVWLLIRFVSLYREYYTQKLIRRGKEHTTVLLNPAVTSLNIIIIFLGLLVWLDNIGFSVTTVLTGLGIGGIAVALATQKSIENFIGALTLYLAAPVKVGDFCRFSNTLGTIEEIGLRATKIRTLENTVVSVPNAEFASMQIENLTERQRYRFNPLIRLHFETTPAQIRDILDKLKQELRTLDIVLKTPQRVHFVGFAEHSLDIEIHCYIDTIDINEFKNTVEELNFRILDIIQSAGTRMALPSTIEYKGQEFSLPSKTQ